MREEQDAIDGRTPRTAFRDFMEVGGIFVMANLLWVLCSLPLITMPAATAGLFAVFVPWAGGQMPEPLAVFFSGMRRYGWKGTAVGLLDLVVGGMVLLNLLILRQMGMGPILTPLALGVTVLAAALALMTNVYVWPLLILQDLPLSNLLQNAIKLALLHPGWTLVVVGTAVIPILISLFLPQVVYVTLTFSTCALIVSKGAWRIIQRSLNPL